MSIEHQTMFYCSIKVLTCGVGVEESIKNGEGLLQDARCGADSCPPGRRRIDESFQSNVQAYL